MTLDFCFSGPLSFAIPLPSWHVDLLPLFHASYRSLLISSSSLLSFLYLLPLFSHLSPFLYPLSFISLLGSLFYLTRMGLFSSCFHHHHATFSSTCTTLPFSLTCVEFSTYVHMKTPWKLMALMLPRHFLLPITHVPLESNPPSKFTHSQTPLL